MYLKALELQGFKSFPDKTVLTFGEDITGIVGPNGSGKSNISDAIRWVMGEQSTKELRGGKMEDVIFGGTQSRAPVGFAEVSLIIDNSAGILPLEENEVMVTRRYYRSGESEFYINRKSVRLRDINELFMDTGMGREGYSVIGQGKIDEIISTKSEDRREVFESAAGIAKFRRRKEEAERKIANTDANLLRINDKVAELELQVEPLRAQSEKAQKYIVLRDELKVLEVSLWADMLDKLRENARKSDEDYTAAKGQLEGLNAKQDELYAQSEALAERMRSHDIASETKRAELGELENLETELESAIAMIKLNIENNRENIRRISEDAEKQAQSAEGVREQIAHHRTRMDEIGLRREAISRESEGLIARARENSQRSGEVRDVIALLEARQEKLRGSLESLRVQLGALEASAREMRLNMENRQHEREESARALSQAQTELEDTEKKLGEAAQARQSAENAIRGYAMRLDSREQRRGELEKQSMDMQMSMNNMASRVRLLGDMEKEYEGYSKAVKNVMQFSARGTVRGVHAPVANLIRTDKPYAVAIEIALGGSAQNVVVDSERDAQSAVEVLKRSDGGRATFLPLTSIRGRRMTEDLSGHKGYLGVASDLCRCEERYSGVVAYLLGRTVIADSLTNAIAMAKATSNRFKIVTLDGQVMNTGGSITGGSVGRNVGILSRAQELESLRGELEKLKKQAQDKESELTEARRQAERAAYELETARGEKRAFDDEVLRLETEREHKAALLRSMEQAAADSLVQEETFNARIEENAAAAAGINRDIEAANAELETVRLELEEKNSGSLELRSEGDTLVNAVGELAREDAALAAEKDAGEKNVRQLEALLADLEMTGQDRENGIIAAQEKEKAYLAELETKNDQLREMTLECEARRVQVREMTALRMDMEAERTRRDREIQDCGKDVMSLSQECARLEQKKIAADMEEQQIIEKLWDTYELNYSSLAPIRVALESTAEAKRSVAELKRKISALGSPNLDSIEEYKRIKERYDYLMSQRDDVQGAKDELEKIISGITSEMRAIFAEKFADINRHFGETFTEMFGGGSASLEMDDPEDVLGCNIDIKVQPPGKTLKTISLLSGGEKAFTAIALYFAMLKVRPTPFCMIDEIDAALDEPNVVRFSQYLRRMSEKTQFIVITHRRSTMEGADVLYGVTMQQKGVSKMLTINLSEAEQEFIRQE